VFKKIIPYLVALVAIAGLGGCGGGGGGDSVSGGAGTAFYLDSPVIGARYSCGGYSGYTGEEGQFTFEYGQGCTLGVGGITLRTVGATELHNGKKIVEIDDFAARLLQSLDYDANPDNGIYIAPEVDAAMADMLAAGAYDPEKVLTDDLTLAILLEEIRAKVPGFEGVLKTTEEAKAHACATVTKVTKELIVGRTFYRYCSNGTDKWIQTYRFDPDGTLYIDNNGAVTTAKYSINAFTVYIYGTESKTYSLVQTAENLLILQDAEGNNLTLYYTPEAARSFEPVLCEGGQLIINDVASVIVGNTYYVPVVENGYAFVRTYEFRGDGSTLVVSWTVNDAGYAVSLTYEATSNYLRFYGEFPVNDQPSYIDRTYLGPVIVTDTYIRFSSSDDRFYKTYDAALWALQN